MITPWQMYWLLKLDDIKTILIVLSVILVGLFGGLIFALLVEGHLCKLEKKEFFILSSGCVLGFLFLFCGIMVPSTKQMATILVLPAIINNEKVQEMGGKTLDIGNDLLDLTKQYLEENIKENK